MSNLNPIISQSMGMFNPDNTHRPLPPAYDSSDIGEWQEDFKAWAYEYCTTLEDFKELSHYNRMHYVKLCRPSDEIKNFHCEYLRKCIEECDSSFLRIEMDEQINKLRNGKSQRRRNQVSNRTSKKQT